jgi:hypothetical protein
MGETIGVFLTQNTTSKSSKIDHNIFLNKNANFRGEKTGENRQKWSS